MSLSLRVRKNTRRPMARVGLYPPQQPCQQPCQQQTVFYFTNTEEMKKMDPYAQLGLTWGENNWHGNGIRM
eukprot:scaffold104889_cov43-Attheya_sp.AAC.2